MDFDRLEALVEERGSIRILDNGVTVIIEHRQDLPLGSGRMELIGGSRYESEEDQGVMHLMEHMLFDKSPTLSRSEREISASLLGMRLNGGTSIGSFVFPVSGNNITGMLLGDHMAPGLRLVTDMIYSPGFTQYSLEKEKDIVVREIFEEIHGPSSHQYNIKQIIKEILFSNNPSWYREIKGTVESVRSLDLDTINNYHSSFFNGANSFFSMICGESYIDPVLEVLESIPPGKRVTPIMPVPENPFSGEIVEMESPLGSDTQVNLFYHIPPEYSGDQVRFRLMDYVLGGNKHSLLYESLRENMRFVYSLSTSFEGHMSTGIYNVSFMVPPENVEEAIATVDETIRQLQEGNFDDRLIDAYKVNNQTHTTEMFYYQGGVYGELYEQVIHDLYGQVMPSLERLKIAQQLTKEDAIQAVSDLGERLTILIR